MLSFFGTKKNGDACGDCNGTICPFLRCSSMKALQTSVSAGLSGYTFDKIPLPDPGLV